MRRLQSIAAGVSRAGALIGGAMLLAAAVTICIDIFLRYAFARTVGGADELAGYALAIAGAWGLSMALLSRSHIRIDTVYVRVKSRAVRAALDVLSVAAFAVFAALVAWHGWGVLRSRMSPGRARSRRWRRRSPFRRRFGWRAWRSFSPSRCSFSPVRSWHGLAAISTACSVSSARNPPLWRRRKRSPRSSRRWRSDERRYLARGATARPRQLDRRRGGHAPHRPRPQPGLFADAAHPDDGRARLVDHEQFHSDRDSVLHHVRRDPAQERHRRAHVQRHGAVAVLAARRPDALQYRLVRDVRLGVGLERGDGRTIGVVAMGEIQKHRYNERLFSASPPAARWAS